MTNKLNLCSGRFQKKKVHFWACHMLGVTCEIGGIYSIVYICLLIKYIPEFTNQCKRCQFIKESNVEIILIQCLWMFWIFRLLISVSFLSLPCHLKELLLYTWLYEIMIIYTNYQLIGAVILYSNQFNEHTHQIVFMS